MGPVREFTQLSMCKGKRILPQICIFILSDYFFFPKYMPVKSTVYDFIGFGGFACVWVFLFCF